MTNTEQSGTKLTYRPEVDGLRAIAVLVVVLYHAELIFFGRDWFVGGYIGVDIFFVISGYLITRIIMLELYDKGSFSFARFYERRARRILPLLFLVIFVSIPFAWFILLPSALVEFAQSIIASLFFYSNFFFYFSTTEYGAQSALLKPLLHTWSLGVEEQFYIFFPVIAIAAFRFGKKHFLGILVILSLLSLQFSEVMSDRDASLNFYLPFSRFWELAIGSILAYRELNHKTKIDSFWTSLLPATGLYLILYSVFSFSSTTPHPGFQTIIPVLGVALIIGFSSQEDLIGKMLGSRAFVSIGLISYSVYLWHFPIFAFARNVQSEPTNFDKLWWIGATFSISILTYFFVEQPFRNKRLVSRLKLIWITLVSYILCVIFALIVWRQDGFESRFPTVIGFENYQADNDKLRGPSWSLLRSRQRDNPVFYDMPGKALILGNSHAKDMFNVLYQNKDLFEDFDFLNYSPNANFQVACFNESVPEYEQTRRTFYDSERYKQATLIIVSTRYGREKVCDSKRVNVEPETSDLDGLPYLIRRVKADGKNIIIMGNKPEFPRIEKEQIIDYVYQQIASSDVAATSAELFSEVDAKASNLLFENLRLSARKYTEDVKLIASRQGVNFYDLIPLVCNEVAEKCTAFTDNGYKTYYDQNHFTLEGAAYFGEKLAADEVFRSMMVAE
ncbi:MAG: acyltransferase [Aquisalinus sp.]|nr:acyltransferase [Aquisalinus sp.]